MDAISRRQFAKRGTVVLGGIITAALGVPIAGYFLSPLFAPRQPIVERQVGAIRGLPERTPTMFHVSFPQPGWKVPEEQHAIYVVRFGSSYRILSTVCTHMQCNVHFDEAIGQFLCPCHGGLYTIDGRNVGGPPPKPLPEYAHRVDADGVLYVQNRLLEQI
jgi:menaquinol-cytochrome c reductase iron-sulfur subunit